MEPPGSSANWVSDPRNAACRWSSIRKGPERGPANSAAPEMPILPVAIDGSWKLLRHNLLPVPFGVRIRIRFADPVARGDLEESAILDHAREEITSTLERWRNEAKEPIAGS